MSATKQPYPFSLEQVVLVIMLAVIIIITALAK